MTNPITTAREAVQAALEGIEVSGVNDTLRPVPVHQFVPANLGSVVPCLVITADDPYIGVGQRFGEVETNLRVVAVVKPAASRVLSEQMDDLLCEAVQRLNPTWPVRSVNAPGVEVINDQAYVTSAISITATEE